MLAGVLILHGHLDATERLLHVGSGLPPVEVAAVGVAAPHRVHLGKVGVRTPLARVDQGQETGAVGPRLRPEDTGRGPPPVTGSCTQVRADVGGECVVGIRLLVEGRDGAHRVVEQRDNVGEGIPEEAGDPHDHVHPRPAELGKRYHLEAGDPPGRVVPGRPAAEQRQHFRNVVTLRTHRGRAPDGQSHRGRIAPGVGEVAGEQRVGECAAGLPGQSGRDRLRIDRVEVPPGRQHVDQPAGG